MALEPIASRRGQPSRLFLRFYPFCRDAYSQPMRQPYDRPDNRLTFEIGAKIVYEILINL